MLRQSEVDDLNTLIAFLARRDVDGLRPEALVSAYGVPQVDRIVLMGGITTPDFAEVVARAFRDGLARGLMVVGGDGHSTRNLRDSIARHGRYCGIPTAGRPEAEMLCDVLVGFCGLARDSIVVESESTNCGNNATFALQAVRRAGCVPRTALIVQDPVMQRRTHESFLHGWRAEDTIFRSFAPIVPLLANEAGALAFAEPRHAEYYRMEKFLDLVMGEIPRLRDDETGYGPRGAGFIGHADVPDAVLRAFDRLLPRYGQHVRPKHSP